MFETDKIIVTWIIKQLHFSHLPLCKRFARVIRIPDSIVLTLSVPVNSNNPFLCPDPRTQGLDIHQDLGAKGFMSFCDEDAAFIQLLKRKMCSFPKKVNLHSVKQPDFSQIRGSVCWQRFCNLTQNKFGLAGRKSKGIFPCLDNHIQHLFKQENIYI